MDGRFDPSAWADLRGCLCVSAGNVVALVEAPRDLGPSTSILRWHVEPSSHPRPEILGLIFPADGGLHARFWNPDGTAERVCGNALRSIPISGLAARVARRVTTDHCVVGLRRAGARTAFSFPISRASVRRLGPGEYLVDVGTPHRIKLVDALLDRRVEQEGWSLSRGENAVNATFVVPGRGDLGVRTFERGVGETRSCGTAALAAFLVVATDCGHVRMTSLPVRFSSGEILDVAARVGDDRVWVSGECHLASRLSCDVRVDGGRIHLSAKTSDSPPTAPLDSTLAALATARSSPHRARRR